MRKELPGEERLLSSEGHGFRTTETVWEWVDLALELILCALTSVNLFVWRSSRFTAGFPLVFFKPITVLLLLLPDSSSE